MSWAPRLIATYLRGRWWRTVEDLLEASYDADELVFDDLELDQDMRELRRAVSQDHLLAFCENILDREEPMPDNDPVLEPFQELPEAGRGFLTLLALNIAIVHLGPPGWAIVTAHLKAGARPRFRQPEVFGALLARATPEAIARHWIANNSPEAWREAALARCQARLSIPQGRALIHLPADPKSAEHALRDLFAKEGLKTCRPDDPERARGVHAYRRSGLCHSLVVPRGQEQESQRWAQQLSRSGALGEAIWVHHAAEAPAIARFRNQRDGQLQAELNRRLREVGAALDDRAVIGACLELGARIYDQDAPRSPKKRIQGPEGDELEGRLHCYRPLAEGERSGREAKGHGKRRR